MQVLLPYCTVEIMGYIRYFEKDLIPPLEVTAAFLGIYLLIKWLLRWFSIKMKLDINVNAI